MARITRKELKADKFALEISHTVDFFEEHQKEILRYGAIAVGVALLVFGYVMYSRHQRAARETALFKAVQVQEAPIGVASNGALSFATQEAKSQEAIKVFTELQKKYPGSDVGAIAYYYLGSIKADQGKLAEAEKDYLEASKSGDDKYTSLAKLSLAQIYFADGRATQGEQVLRELMAKPTLFVSKDLATITLARHLAGSKPAEARKLLEPLLKKPGGVSQVAIALESQIPK